MTTRAQRQKLRNRLEDVLEIRQEVRRCLRCRGRVISLIRRRERCLATS